MAYSDDIQRDYVRWCGMPLGFMGVAAYGQGTSPLTTPGNANLKSWHRSNAGLVIAPTLIQNNGAAPGIIWDADVTQSVPFRLDILTTGIRGVSTYGCTIDGGLSYFQTGLTAFNVPVALFGRVLQMATGTFTVGDQYLAVCKSMANQTPLLRTLNGAPTDSAKPLIVPNSQNGFPCLTSTGGTSGAMTDISSAWAADVASGSGRDMTWFIVGAADSAAPSGIRAFFSFGNTGLANPCYYLGARNGTNNFRAGHVIDSGTATNRDGGALTTTFHVWSVVQSGGNVAVWEDGASIVASVGWGAGATTLNCAALFCLFRNSAQTNNNQHRFLAMTTYDAALSTAERQANEAYFKGVYATP